MRIRDILLILPCFLNLGCRNTAQPKYLLYNESLIVNHGSYLLCPEGTELYIIDKELIDEDITSLRAISNPREPSFILEKVGGFRPDISFVRVNQKLADSLLANSKSVILLRNYEHQYCTLNKNSASGRNTHSVLELEAEVIKELPYQYVGHFLIPKLTRHMDERLEEVIYNNTGLQRHAKIIRAYQAGYPYSVLIGADDTTGIKRELRYPIKWTDVGLLNELHLCSIE